MNCYLRHHVTALVGLLFIVFWLPACSKTPDSPESESVLPDKGVQQQERVQRQEGVQKQEVTRYRELSAEDQIKAQNLLREGQLHIEVSRKLRMENPGKGIEACRKVLAEYGDTEYAEQAYALLRRVPERYKKDYNITDEELGL